MAAPTFVADELVTATKMNDLPKGYLGYAARTANQAGISTEADLTGLSVTVTVAANRRLKVTGHVGVTANDTTGNLVRLSIKESTTYLQVRDSQVWLDSDTLTYYSELSAVVVLTPTAGAHTYKLALQRVSGTGTVGMWAASTAPAFLLVEDIGAA